MNRKLTKFKLKIPEQQSREIASQLGSGRGVFIEFYDRPELPLEWEAPFVFKVNRVDVGFLSGDILKIDLEALKRVGGSYIVLENLAKIADQIVEKESSREVDFLELASEAESLISAIHNQEAPGTLLGYMERVHRLLSEFLGK